MEKKRWKIGWRHLVFDENNQDVNAQSIIMEMTTKECFTKINQWNKQAVLTGRDEFYYAELAN